MRIALILLAAALLMPGCDNGHDHHRLPAPLALPTPCDHDDRDRHENGQECGQVRRGCEGEPEDFRPCPTPTPVFVPPPTTLPGAPEPPIAKPTRGGTF